MSGVDELVCLQCGQTRTEVKENKTFCATVDYFGHTDQDWDRHRWADCSDRELDRAGIKPEAYEKHRRTNVNTLTWVDCDDTKRGHAPADEEAVGGMWADRVGQCIYCGKDLTTLSNPTREEDR